MYDGISMASKNVTRGKRDGGRFQDLFAFDIGTPYVNAEINFLPKYGKPAWHESQWELYIAGYKAAGDRLIGTLRKYRVPTANGMVYPILYLYRHYFELRLKEIIESGNMVRSKTKRVECERFGHNLDRAWQECQKIFEETGLQVGPAQLMEAGEFIIWLSDTSEDLRYPIRKPSKNPRRNVWDRRDINLAKLRKYMQRVSSLLEKGSKWVQLTRDQVAEFNG